MQILYLQLIILSSTNKIAKHAPNFPRLSMRENKCARLSRKNKNRLCSNGLRRGLTKSFKFKKKLTAKVPKSHITKLRKLAQIVYHFSPFMAELLVTKWWKFAQTCISIRPKTFILYKNLYLKNFGNFKSGHRSCKNGKKLNFGVQRT